MDREQIIAALQLHRDVLAARFGVNRLALFGSIARGTARADSDVDLLVAFDGPATSGRFFGLQFYLEDLLGRRIDLVTERALRERLRPFVERDAIVVRAGRSAVCRGHARVQRACAGLHRRPRSGCPDRRGDALRRDTAQSRTARRSCIACARVGSRQRARDSVATDRRDAQPPRPWLPRHRCGHGLEHREGRYSCVTPAPDRAAGPRSAAEPTTLSRAPARSPRAARPA